jgi:adenosine deaminase
MNLPTPPPSSNLNPKKMNILLCTLGASWPVIPEIFGFVAPDQLDLYAEHPNRAQLAELRAKHGIAAPDELWICTTEGAQTQKSMSQIKAWWALLGAPLPLRIWTAAGTDQLATQAECDHIRELTLRLVLLASETCRGGQLVLSLAGGRKTMSADLQWAGTLFGTQAMLHVVGPDPLPEALARKSQPETFIGALPPELASAITPLVVGSSRRDELLDVSLDGHTVNSSAFPLPLAECKLSERAWPLPAAGATLTANIQARQRQGSGLLGNFIAQLAAREKHDLYTVTEPRLALRDRLPHTFANYERPGELSGSAILGHPAALLPYARALVAQAQAEGLAYLELRGSPHKYRPSAPAAFVRELAAALAAAGANQAHNPHSPLIRFIWILDRRQANDLPRLIEHAVRAFTDSTGFLVGLDLAGDEAHHQPEQLAPSFIAAFRECLPITIHAGEGESADNIWQAAYHLHADRIGHGLSLAERPELATRFRNRGVALELCPTSNREVIGYRDTSIAASADYPVYPLRTFIELGLPLTLCTDNPAISRTTLADEYLTAARISQGGLSHWETLALVKQGFAHSFLPAAERESLLKQIDQRIYRQLSRASIWPRPSRAMHGAFGSL